MEMEGGELFGKGCWDLLGTFVFFWVPTVTEPRDTRVQVCSGSWCQKRLGGYE